MNEHSIFQHAQLGHVKDRAPKTPEPAPKKQATPRPRPLRGWAVEAELGLGPKFSKGRKP